MSFGIPTFKQPELLLILPCFFHEYKLYFHKKNVIICCTIKEKQTTQTISFYYHTKIRSYRQSNLISLSKHLVEVLKLSLLTKSILRSSNHFFTVVIIHKATEIRIKKLNAFLKQTEFLLNSVYFKLISVALAFTQNNNSKMSYLK